jgi:hypothetical protein
MPGIKGKALILVTRGGVKTLFRYDDGGGDDDEFSN